MLLGYNVIYRHLRYATLVDYNIQMAELHQANSELSRHSQLIEEDNMHLKVQRAMLSVVITY